MGLFAKFGTNKKEIEEPHFEVPTSETPASVKAAADNAEAEVAVMADEAVSESDAIIDDIPAEVAVMADEAVSESDAIIDDIPVEVAVMADETASEGDAIIDNVEPEIKTLAEDVKVEKSSLDSNKIIETSDGLKRLDIVNNIEIESVVLGEINKVEFSDVYITPDRRCYIWGGKTNAGLILVSFSDFGEFFVALNQSFDGRNRSYLLQYKGRNYRVERTVATGGPQFCARKMPTKVPNLKDLGLPRGVYNHLLSLAGGSGLILLAGATGSGKSTTIAALLKEYLSQKGGYAFTIEDPVELPLDGIYITPNNELGLCKQTTPPDGVWAEGIKSALRSKPRYIYLGEIRSPDIASEALRAATSGHLVLSSIHANNVNEAVNSLVKYAASSGISESMAFELVAGGLLGIVHQILTGAPKRAQVTTIFTNPDVNAGCQVRGMIRNGKLNMATLIEQQRILLQANKPLFSSR